MITINKNLDELFEKNVKRTSGKNWYEIKCKFGLWGVTSPEQSFTEKEAKRYFSLYYADGEYERYLEA